MCVCVCVDGGGGDDFVLGDFVLFVLCYLRAAGASLSA